MPSLVVKGIRILNSREKVYYNIACKKPTVLAESCLILIAIRNTWYLHYVSCSPLSKLLWKLCIVGTQDENNGHDSDKVNEFIVRTQLQKVVLF